MYYDFVALHNYALLYRYFQDPRAFQVIENALRGYILVAIRRSGVADDESDLYQTILCDIHRLVVSPSWRSYHQPFHTIVRRVVSNAVRTNYVGACRHIRRVNTEAVPLEGGVLFELPDSRSFEDQVLIRATLHQALAKADPLTRTCADLLLMGYNYPEVGRCVGLSASGVRHRFARLRARLTAERSLRRYADV